MRVEKLQIDNLDELGVFCGKLASDFLAEAKRSGLEVSLEGELGAGKTAFVKALGRQLRLDGEVSSPSFVLGLEYNGAEGLVVEHWDLYRLNSLPDELIEPAAPGLLRLVEWGDKIPEYQLRAKVRLRLSFLDDLGAAGDCRRNLELIDLRR